MAQGFMQQLSSDRIEVRSAGTAPADSINPAVVESMAEKGIDLSANSPKILEDQTVRDSDYVITMGCGDECPFYPGKTYLDWPLDDPAGQGVEFIRPIRDEIEQKVLDLIAEIDKEHF